MVKKRDFFAFMHLPKDGVLRIELTGRIDEQAKLPPIALEPGVMKVVVQLQEVTAINSVGVRSWTNWLKDVPPGKLEFTHCPRCIVDQFNMAMGFLPKGATVSSFQVPYFDSEAEAETNVLFKQGEDYDENAVTFLWQMKGPKGQELDLDVIPKRYFAFLRTKLVPIGVPSER